MKTVSVINIKGGVGKTTLTANLGAYAASQGRRVLMIDIDPQASLTFSFIPPEVWREKYSQNMTLKNFFSPIISYSDAVPSLSSLSIPLGMGDMFLADSGNLRLVSSHLDMTDIDIQLASGINVSSTIQFASTYLRTYSNLHSALMNEAGNYDLVLLDCPPNFGALVRNAIIASDDYIVPAKLDYLSSLGVASLKSNVSKFLAEYHRLSDELANPRYDHVSLTMLGIVPMMVSVQKGEDMIAAQKEYMNEFSANGCRIFQFVRNNGTLFASSPKTGVPAVMTRPGFFSSTARTIVNELQTLGREFLSSLR